LVTVTLRVPVVAPDAIAMFAVSDVALLNVVELTVIPVPENDADAPVTKFVPVIVTLKLVAPWSPELGLVEVTVGAALTVNTPVPVPTPPSGLVTVTLRAPVVAPAAIAMFAVSCVALTNVVELTVIPVPENDADAPVTKFVPVIVTLKLVAPLSPELGLVEVTVGPALTVNTFVPVAVVWSPLVMVTSPAPVVALPAIVIFAVSDVALTNVVELTVIPVPENDADAPLTKPVPVIVTLWLVAP
jgi:hypothetical protein